MWFYVTGILRAHQIVEARVKQIPRGNLSDLYPRWLGARELLLHHRNPYSREIALEIQEGYYGRRLDPERPNDPKDQQGFAYPVYVVFLLAPLVCLPFPVLLVGFYWFLVVLTGASIWLWLRVLRWELPLIAIASSVVLTLGSFPAVQGIKLQQLSLLVAALLAGAAACVAGGFLFCGGALLALATVKPQVAWPLVVWFVMWGMGDWRVRRRLVFSFGLVMALLLAGGEILLPGWWRMFAQAIGQYNRYAKNQSVLEVIFNQVMPGRIPGMDASQTPAHVAGIIFAVLAVIVCGTVLWRLRREPAGGSGFGSATALVLALTVLVVPMFAPYNQVLLLPAILLLARERAVFLSRSWVRRLAYVVGALLVAWQWIASLGLTLTYCLVSHERALEAWTWPFFATFVVPVWVFGLIFFYVRRSHAELKTSDS